MTDKIKFRLIITIPVILFSAMIITIYLRFIKVNPLGTTIIVLAIGGLYFLAINLISSRRIQLFSTESIPKPDKINELMDYYKAIGGTPLKTLILFLLLAFLYMTGLFFYVTNHQVATNIALTFLGLVFSSIMLCSSFSYVLLDKLIISFLYKNNIYSYPSQLIESRQKSKNIIIPVFMSLMTMIYSLNIILITYFSQDLDNLLSVYMSIGIFIFIFLIIMFPLVVIWARGTAQLYGQINDRLEEMVTGEKDLTKRINICSVDEMSTLSNRINLFSDIINDHMVETGSIFAKLNRNQLSLSENITISSESVKEISHHINVLTSNVENEYAMVKDTLDTGKSLISDLEDVVSHVNDQSVSVSESSAAVEEMIASITEVSRRTLNVKEKTSEMTKRFITGQEKIDKTVQSVSNVVQFSKSLVEINNLISGIAAQTNLLAMNAAIEAAHAGEAGKGFSVVADEIRKLAENTASHTKTSSENLKQILGEIDVSLKVAEETGVIFGEMKEGITLIDDESYSISETMTEHDRANKQVLEQLSETNRIAEKLSDSASQISEKGNSMLTSLETLESSAGKSFEHCSGVNERNNAIKENIEELLSLSKETDEINKRTQELVNSFKLD